MAISTTPDKVREINGSTLDDLAIQPFIDAAICVLALSVSCMSIKGVTAECQDIAATWLAAHMLAMTSLGENTNVKKKESFENYSVEMLVGGFSGKGVLSTAYGQTANTMTGGCLQESDKGNASVCFFG